MLWCIFKKMYDHLKLVHLSQALNDRMHLRLQDFKSVSDYNSELFRISSKLLLC